MIEESGYSRDEYMKALWKTYVPAIVNDPVWTVAATDNISGSRKTIAIAAANARAREYKKKMKHHKRKHYRAGKPYV